jgi:transposase
VSHTYVNFGHVSIGSNSSQIAGTVGARPVTGLVFVDENGGNTQMMRWRGRALGGRKLVAHIPHGSYQTSTLISGIRWEGSCTPWLFERPMNGEKFLAWVEQGLAPTLRAGDLMILDNLATHKIRGVREAIQSRGARLLYPPPDSPDFNPIEPMGCKIKQILRSHAPRTETELLEAAKAAFQAISLTDCRGFFFGAKYATSFMEML